MRLDNEAMAPNMRRGGLQCPKDAHQETKEKAGRDDLPKADGTGDLADSAVGTQLGPGRGDRSDGVVLWEDRRYEDVNRVVVKIL